MKLNITKFNYNNCPVSFNKRDEGVMINATEMAKMFSKKVQDWTRQKSSREYIDAVSSDTGITVSALIQSVKGGNGSQGTWMHEDIALEFARWLNPKFGVWCNNRVKELLHYGITGTPEALEKLANNPDLLIEIAKKLKFERAAKEKALSERDRANKKANEYKEKVDELTMNFKPGLTIIDTIKQFNGVSQVGVLKKLRDLGFLKYTTKWSNISGISTCLCGYEGTGQSAGWFQYNIVEAEEPITTAKGWQFYRNVLEIYVTHKGARHLYYLYKAGKLPMRKNWDGKFYYTHHEKF